MDRQTEGHLHQACFASSTNKLESVQRCFTRRLTGLAVLWWTFNCTRIRTAGIKSQSYDLIEFMLISLCAIRSYMILLTFPLMLSLSLLIAVVLEDVHWNCHILMLELTLVLIHFLYVLSLWNRLPAATILATNLHKRSIRNINFSYADVGKM